MGITCERWKPIGKVQKSRQKSILAHRDYVLKIMTNSCQKAQNKFLGSQHNISLSHGQAHWTHSYRYHLLLICLTILSRLTVTVRKYVISEPCNKHFVYYWQISLISIQKKNNSRNNQGHHTATKKTDIPEGVSSEGKKISSMFQEWGWCLNPLWFMPSQ